MRLSPPDAELDGPFRAPERLALVMPLLSVVGLMFVVCAAATGQSTLVVALVAVVGFGVCALAPMALLELYVARPLRALLANLRAARDGQETPGSAPVGVIGDLVAVARDIRAGQASAERMTSALTEWEQKAAASDQAMRAFRQQCEELAETKVNSVTSQFAEICDALKSLKAAPVGPGDGAMERIEQMLVYLAEIIERRDGQDKRADEGLERVEQTLTDIVRLIGRETQALRDSVSTAAMTVRNDIAATVADDRAVESRQSDRLETLETRVLSKLAAPETAGLADTIRQEAEATRQALVAKIAESSEGETKTLATLTRTTEKLRNAIDRLDALSASASSIVSMQNDDLKATLRALEGEVAGFGGRLEGAVETLEGVASCVEASGQAHIERLDALKDDALEAARGALGEAEGRLNALGAQAKAQTNTILARLDASAAAWENQASALTLAASVDAQTLAALRSDIGTVKARVAEVAPRAAAVAEMLEQRLVARLDAFDATMLQAAAHDLADAQTRGERHADEIAASAAALATLAAREGRDFNALGAAFAQATAELSRQGVTARQSYATGMGEGVDALVCEATSQADAPGGPLAETFADLERGLAASSPLPDLAAPVEDIGALQAFNEPARRAANGYFYGP